MVITICRTVNLDNIYDNEAPLNFLATQTPSLVRILWTDLVSGST